MPTMPRHKRPASTRRDRNQYPVDEKSLVFKKRKERPLLKEWFEELQDNPEDLGRNNTYLFPQEENPSRDMRTGVQGVKYRKGDYLRR